MNVFTTFFQADWVERAGWALLHSLWQIAAVAAVYMVFASLLRNRSADSRYVLACVAMLAVLVLPMGSYVILSHDMPREEVARANDADTLAASPSETPIPPSDPAESAGVTTDSLPPVAYGDPLPSEVVSPGSTATTAVTPLPQGIPATPTVTGLMRRCLPWITAAWLTGVMILSLRPLLGWWYVRRLRRHGLSRLSDTLQLACQRVKQRLGVNRAVQCAQSALVEVPMVVGWLRPMILLPASAITSLSTAQIELVLAHELAHVRRHDWLITFAQSLIEALLFYHPAMWWISKQIRRERENCCDDVAVEGEGDRMTYVRALLRLEEHRSPLFASASSATGGSLLLRVRRLIVKPNGEFGSAPAAVWFLALASLLLVLVVTANCVRAWEKPDRSSERELIATKETQGADPADAPLGPDEGLRGRQAQLPKETAVEEKPLPTLKVRVLDKDRQPVPGRPVLLSDRYHGTPENFELVSRRTDEDGWADMGMLPQDYVYVQVFGGPHELRNGQTRNLSEAYAVINRDGDGSFRHANPDKPIVRIALDRETNTLVITFTMRQGVDVQFQAVDAESGKELPFTGVYYSGQTRQRWWHPSMVDGSYTQHNFSPIPQELDDAPFRLVCSGYYPVEFELGELELGKEYKRRFELTPAPDIRFTILTPEGEAAEGARIDWIHPRGLDNMGYGKRTSDADGVWTTKYPAQGELASFEITHQSGQAFVPVKNLPEPVTVAEDGESRDVILYEVRLPRHDSVQAVLLPGEFEYGKQSLTVHTTNDSSMTQFLARGDYPQEILVDGVTYRMARFDIGWYALKPRPILPRSRDHGSAVSLPKISANGEEVKPIQLSGSVFDRPKIWMNYENRMPLQLTPDKHTVQAVFYLLDPKTGRRGRRILSNAIEIGADGRAIEIDTTRPVADFRNVRIRMLGGAARKPLAGLELTVSCGGMESYSATTEQDGVAAIRLPYGYHRVSFTSPRDLPYLPFRYDSIYPWGNTRPIHVAKTSGPQTIELVLADPCELVLRAVDADTGKGIPGVRFALESMYGEMWAVPIRDETIRARPKDRRATQVADDEKPLDTDEQGYFRRYVGPRHDEWSYWVDVSPDGYRLVSPRGDVKIDTSLGRKRAEQTFLFRRRDADATKVD